MEKEINKKHVALKKLHPVLDKTTSQIIQISNCN